jgi:hypothetical protein
MLISACGGEPEDSAREAADPTAATEATGVWFRDGTAAAGIDFVHDAGVTVDKHLPETMGAGAALVDVDGDGDLDMYFVQSGPMPFGDDTVERPTNRLYLNDGKGRFTDATEASGDAAHTGYGMGVAAADVDADGDVDFFVTNLGPDVLLLNDGTGRFTDATPAALADPRWTAGATFFDGDGDGDLDLYVTGYVDIDFDDPAWCGDHRPGYRSYCHPDAYEGLADHYYRNEGQARFVDATEAAGFGATPGMPGKGLGVIASDLDGDGDLDLYVANDSVENRLWINNGDGTFEDGTLISGTGTNSRGMTEAGMGLASGDVDGDGDIDLFVTNFDDESNTLYRNDGQGLFTDVTVEAGLEAASRRPVGFGCVLADLDNDTDLDLVVTNGHIIDNVALYDDAKTHAQVSQLFFNDGAGHFTEATGRSGALAAVPVVGRGLYAGDWDGDGDLDLLLTQCGGPARLLLNAGSAPRALSVAGLPAGSRVRAILASGRTVVREVGQQVSYFGAGSPELHLGVPADDSVVELQVTVPGALPPGHPIPNGVQVLPLPPQRRSGRWTVLIGPEGLTVP